MNKLLLLPITILFACGTNTQTVSNTIINDSINFVITQGDSMLLAIERINKDTIFAKLPNSNWYDALGEEQQLAQIKSISINLAQETGKVIKAITPKPKTDWPAIKSVTLSINPNLQHEQYSSNYETQYQFTDSIITIKYAQKVNGYDVRVKWSPDACEGLNSYLGSAYITFENKEGSFTIKTPYFFDPVLWKIGYKRYINKTLSLNYSNPEDTFFFKDVDFDGDKELIIIGFTDGAYGVHSWYVYDINNNNPVLRKEPPLGTLTSSTKFDYDKQIITAGGGNAMAYNTYKWQKQSTGEFRLVYNASYDFREYTFTAINAELLQD